MIIQKNSGFEMKYETTVVAIEEFVGVEPKMYSYLVDDNSEHKKAKCINKSIVQTISPTEYKDVLMNRKYLRYSLNRIQSKDHRIGTYEINKISVSCFDDKIYIAWHTKRWRNFCLSEDKKKEVEPIFTERLRKCASIVHNIGV